MCKANEFSSQILNIFNDVESLYFKLNKELSHYDLMRSDILHKIELENFSASEGYKLCKQLKDISLKRRLIKDELEPLHSFQKSILNFKTPILKAHNQIITMDNSRKNRKYIPKVLKDI